MLKLLLTFLVVGLILTPRTALANANPVIYNATNQQIVSLADLAKLPKAGEVIMFGEFHDQNAIHQLEAELFQQIVASSPNFPLALSLEMFERDTQAVMNDYLAGKITEADFLQQARPWPRYASDYRALVETAKQHQLTVIAGNVPRSYANKYMKTGSLADLDKRWLPQKTIAPDNGYKQLFFAAMAANAETGMKVPPMMYQAMYKAQCLKDDTMAESIAKHLNEHHTTFIYHVQGSFHGNYHYGVAEKLANLAPQTKITVIAPVFREPGKTDIDLVTENQTIGDFILLLDKE